MRCACGASASPRPSARHWRKLEKAIAEAQDAMRRVQELEAQLHALLSERLEHEVSRKA